MSIIVQIGTPASFASGVTDTVSPNNGGTLVTPNFIQGVAVTDPSSGAGYAASEGSLYLSTSGVAYIKTGTADTDWNVSEAASPAGSNTQIQFNNSSLFGASSKLTWNGTTLTITGDAAISGNIAVTTDAAVTGNVAVTGNTAVTGDVAAATYHVGATAGVDANITTAGLVGKTIVVSKGLIVGFA